jgi:hypothetical protein
MDRMRTISEKTALDAIIPDQHLRIRIDSVPANVPHAWLRKKLPRRPRAGFRDLGSGRTRSAEDNRASSDSR